MRKNQENTSNFLSISTISDSIIPIFSDSIIPIFIVLILLFTMNFENLYPTSFSRLESISEHKYQEQKIDLISQCENKTKSPVYHYQLAVASIFKDEAPYLKEWVEFHLMIGVEQFYLFNNLSSDNYLEILKPYIDQKIVQLIDWPYVSQNLKDWNPIQCQAYEHALNLSRGVAKWVAFIDIDEYLFPIDNDNLVNVLSNYEEFPGVAVNWVMFGTSWVSKIPEKELLIQALILRGQDSLKDNTFVKSIIQPIYVQECTNPHFFIYPSQLFQVNTDKIPFQGLTSPYFVKNKIRINHYWGRDEQFLNNVKIPRHKKWYDDSSNVIFNNKLYNQVEDSTILRFVPSLRKRMGYD